MADVILPWNIPPTSIEWRLIDSTSVFRSPYSGAVRTLERSGARLGCTINWQNLNAAKRRALIAFAAQLRGRTNRVRIFDDGSVRAGVMAAPELLSNNAFQSGTTGWNAQISTLTANNGVLRARATRASGSAPGAYQNPAAAINVPYCGRSVILQKSPGFTTSGIYLGDATASLTNYTAALDYKLLTYTPSASPLTFYPGVGAAGNWTTDDFIDIGWSSLARCALLDGGGNQALQSDTLATTWTQVNVTIASNSGTAADGTTTADGLQETAVNSNHSITQSFTVTASAQDVVLTYEVKAGTRGFCALEWNDGVGTASAYVNLSTGAVTNTFSGTNFTNTRGFATSLGQGWWRCFLVTRKTGSATSLTGRLYAATAAGTSNYLGVVGADAILARRGGMHVGSHPCRTDVTTTSVVALGNQSGSGLYLKGLPPSTNALLEAGDRVEINGQMVIATAALDSDAAGMGYLQCFPPLRTPSASDTPVIFTAPTMRGILVPDEIGWQTQPGGFSDFSLQFEEAF